MNLTLSGNGQTISSASASWVQVGLHLLTPQLGGLASAPIDTLSISKKLLPSTGIEIPSLAQLWEPSLFNIGIEGNQ